MINDKSNIVRVAALATVNSEAEDKDKADKEVSADIRARMEAKWRSLTLRSGPGRRPKRQ